LIKDTLAFDPDLAYRIAKEQGEEQYLQYIALFRELEQSKEILPKLLVYEPVQGVGGCPRLIDAFPKAMHSDKNPEDVSQVHFTGLDYLDALRYLVMGFKARYVAEPFDSVRDRHIKAAQDSAKQRGKQLSTADLIQINRKIEHDWEHKKQGLDPITPVRSTRAWMWRDRKFARSLEHQRELNIGRPGWDVEDRKGGWEKPYAIH
jgi:hypothetical protein